MAWELRAWRTKIMLQEDSKPIMDDHGQLVRIAPDTEEATPIEPGKCTSPSHGLLADRRRDIYRLQYSRYGLLYSSRPMQRFMSLCGTSQRMRADLPRTLQNETTGGLTLVRYQMPKALARLLMPIGSNQHHQEMYSGEMRV